jgi:hypothetical protein
VAISARRSSTTMDFSCVTTKSGLVHWTAMPVCCSCAKTASFGRSPEERCGLSITRTATPRRWASMMACTRRGSLKVNYLTRNDFVAAVISVSTGSTPSSGCTTNVRCDVGCFMTLPPSSPADKPCRIVAHTTAPAGRSRDESTPTACLARGELTRTRGIFHTVSRRRARRVGPRLASADPYLRVDCRGLAGRSRSSPDCVTSGVR